jgi:hypothetical protein
MFESFMDLFKSAKEREKDRRLERRRLERSVERQMERLKVTATDFEKRGITAQNAAKTSLLGGDRVGAKRKLIQARQYHVISHNLEGRIMVAETRLAQIRSADSGAEIAAALKGLSEAMNINPLEIEEVLAETGDRLEEAGEIDAVWEREGQRDLERIGMKEVEGIPGVDEMMRDLEKSAGVALNPEANKVGSPQSADARLERFKKLREDPA